VSARGHIVSSRSESGSHELGEYARNRTVTRFGGVARSLRRSANDGYVRRGPDPRCLGVLPRSSDTVRGLL